MFELIYNIYTLAIIAALIPAALLLFYIYRQDSVQPEPVRLLWKGVWYGVASALAVLFVFAPILSAVGLDDFSDTTLGAIQNAFIGAAIPEETAKMFFLWLLLRKNPYFDEHLDGIVYSTCIGLGFAGLENIIYLVSDIDNLVSVAIFRGIFSVPGHFFNAVAMGYFLSLAHFGNIDPDLKNRYYVLAFLVPVLMHGIFDSLLMVSSVNPSLSIVCMIAFVYIVHRMRKIAVQRIKTMKESDQYVRDVENFTNSEK